jgi:radical SAM superfamily enzyme YgiQ (UPF0313 family)
MKMLFIMPLAYPVYSFQIAALSAFLKKNGHTVEFLELILEEKITKDDLGRLNTKIESFMPDIIGFSSYELSFSWIQELSDFIKARFVNIPIIVGGYHATLAPEEVIAYPSIDMICRGEGEYALLELLNQIAHGKINKSIKNIWFKDGKEIIRNEIGPMITDLDKLPFVDRTFYKIGDGDNQYLEIMGSRGCPYDCTNCCNSAFKDLYGDRAGYLRFRSPDHVISEIEECLMWHPFSKIYFEDDTFTASLKWLKEFSEKYKKNVKLPFVCNVRPETGNLERLGLIKEAGCDTISIGVEAGDEYVRRTVLNRRMTNKQIIDAFKNAKKLKLKTKSFNMVGLPHENRAALWKTIFLNLKIAPTVVQTTVYYPFKGTKLGNECYEKGWVDMERKKRLKLLANDSILNLPGLSRFEIRVAKWLNSATALRSGNPEIIKGGFKLITSRIRRGNLI